MIVGIAGLGLIGGSLAKAYKQAGEHTVLALDRDPGVLHIAMVAGAVDGELNEQSAARCDLVLVALYPGAAIQVMQRLAPSLRQDALLIDCCGTKRAVCEEGFKLSKEYGFLISG